MTLEDRLDIGASACVGIALLVANLDAEEVSEVKGIEGRVSRLDKHGAGVENEEVDSVVAYRIALLVGPTYMSEAAGVS